MKTIQKIMIESVVSMFLIGAGGILTCAQDMTETENGLQEIRTETQAQPGADTQFPAETMGDGWTDRDVPLQIDHNADAGYVTLRFYDDMPNVPYINAAVFNELVDPDCEAEVSALQDGVYLLKNRAGQAEVDTDKDIFSSDDYYAYTDTAGPSASAKAGEKLDAAPYCRYLGTDAVPEACAVTFDFSKYHIDLRAEEDGPYFPFTTIASLYYDSSFMYRAAYNLNKVIVNHDINYGSMSDLDEQWAQSVLLMEERPADLAEYGYSQLCFSLETFYGYPGSEKIDEKIMKEQGLDAALKAYGELGENAARLLQSCDMVEYIAGSQRLRALLWDGDHTNIDFILSAGSVWTEEIGDLTTRVGQFSEELDDGYQELMNEIMSRRKTEESSRYFDRDQKRKEMLGEGTYFTSGNTALCVFDSFSLNQEAWDAYYADENRDLDTFLEQTQDDSIVILLNALRKAQADPEIENFVVDMTMNLGGNDGVAGAVESLLTGEAISYVKEMISGYSYTAIFEVDRNFDGVFDEKDEEVRYDFNFAVLTGGDSYSNGTMVPAVLKDQGVLVLGETTRGGCCTLQSLVSAEGFDFWLSSGRLHHINKDGSEMEQGAVPDIELYLYDEDGNRKENIKEISTMDSTDTISVPDYSALYDLEKIGQIMDEYYGG